MPFSGTWFHSATEQSVIDEILSGDGWHPDCVRNTIYGTAVYLSNCNWYNEYACDRIIACELNLQPGETMYEFDATEFARDLGIGSTEKHLHGYFRINNIPAYQNPFAGSHAHNRARRDFFLQSGIRAIRFTEFSVPVIAVYDPRVIVSERAIPRGQVPKCPVPVI